jgi:hypothetical protein
MFTETIAVFPEKQTDPTSKLLKQNVVLFNVYTRRIQEVLVCIDAKVRELMCASICLLRKHDFRT